MTESSAIGAELFLFGETMADILLAARSYAKLLDVEYHILSINFEKLHFYHLAGLHYLKDLADALKGDRGIVFEKILNGKYFCRSFFPQMDKDYSLGHTNWTVLYKKKINKSEHTECILCDKLRKNS